MGLFAKFGMNKAVTQEQEPRFDAQASAPKPEPIMSAPEVEEVVSAPEAKEAMSVSEVEEAVNIPEAEEVVSVSEAKEAMSVSEVEETANIPEAEEIMNTPEVEAVMSAPEPIVSAPEPESIVSVPEPEPIVSAPKPEPIVSAPEPEPVATSEAPQVGKIIETPDGLRKIDVVDNIEIESVVLSDINSVEFSDVYITPDKRCYIWGGKTNAGLMLVSFKDFEEFFAALNNAFDGVRSYLLQYKGRNYRVERTIATGGPQFCARKMPTKVPNLKDLGLPQGVYNHLLSLAGGSGLILLAGATGSGKSTTIAALLKEYLSQKGGYAFTIEDPVELPLDGVYLTPKNEIGLCKQTTPPDGSWAEGIKSALRSKPRYIYLGEIRSPDIASEALRAATSGHLVLSSIHANNVNEAVNSLVKYAASSGISESMAYELVAGGLLGIVHQILKGAPKHAEVTTIFANPDVNAGCQVRGMIRNGKLNMATLMEQQRILLQNNKPLFSVI